jgi:glycine cleavage system H protein
MAALDQESGMSCPADRRYLDTHEWHRPDGDTITIGITRFAIDELTDITYVQLPAVGTAISAGTAIGEIESVKATSELYSGISGKVSAVNQAVMDDPSIINQDPYEKGWLLKVQPSNPSELDGLLDARTYAAKYPGH